VYLRFIRYVLHIILTSVFLFSAAVSYAGGITLGATRIIYPENSKQFSLSVRNTSNQSSFMVQSWVEDASGHKTEDFIVTPPVYVSGPNNENTLRLIYTGDTKESASERLYYYNSKAIPSLNKKEIEGKNILMLAATTRIKLFVRPQGLQPAVEKAPELLKFRRVGGKVIVENPTPYHITMVHMKAGNQKIPDTMVSPRSSLSLPLPAGAGNNVSFRTINDFGAATPVVRVTLQ
jgi:P pilus assembly chaperone PapD